jgi:hypothetical protein
MVVLGLAVAAYMSRLHNHARVVAFIERLAKLRFVAEVKLFLLFVTVGGLMVGTARTSPLPIDDQSASVNRHKRFTSSAW